MTKQIHVKEFADEISEASREKIRHPEYGCWRIEENTPIRQIPTGAMIVWHADIWQYGFHLGGGDVAYRDGIVAGKTLPTAEDAPLVQRTFVVACDGRPIVFGEAALRSEFQAGKYRKRQDFLSACIGDIALAEVAELPVWVFETYGRAAWFPVAPDAEFEAAYIGDR